MPVGISRAVLGDLNIGNDTLREALGGGLRVEPPMRPLSRRVSLGTGEDRMSSQAYDARFTGGAVHSPLVASSLGQ
jgi:hypothetical protein